MILVKLQGGYEVIWDIVQLTKLSGSWSVVVIKLQGNEMSLWLGPIWGRSLWQCSEIIFSAAACASWRWDHYAQFFYICRSSNSQWPSKYELMQVSKAASAERTLMANEQHKSLVSLLNSQNYWTENLRPLYLSLLARVVCELGLKHLLGKMHEFQCDFFSLSKFQVKDFWRLRIY